MESMSHYFKKLKVQRWLLATIVILTISLGWKYDWISLTVPIVMFIGISSIFTNRGRYVCGNICPRGAFYDSVLKPFSRKKPIPEFLKNRKFRWIVLITLFTLFLVRILTSPPPLTVVNLAHIFWMMCVLTTSIGVVLGLFFTHRTWCAFCPIGTLISTFAQDRRQLQCDRSKCVRCKLCERACPLNLPILSSDKDPKCMQDCLKCKTCVEICPKHALKIPEQF